MSNKKYVVLSHLCVFLLAFFSVTLLPECSAENIGKEDFVRESTKAWDELLSIYKKKGVSLSFQRQQTYDKNAGKDVPYIHTRVRVLGNYQFNEVEAPDGRTDYVRAVNDRYSFGIIKEQNADWVIQDLKNNPEGMIDTTNNNLNLLSLTPYIYQGLIVQDCWLKDIVTCDSFVIKSINELNDKRNQISIDFSVDHKISSTQTLTNGTLVFDKSQYWIVRHSKVTLIETINNNPVEYLITAEKEYKSIDGIPFPAAITTILVTPNIAASPVLVHNERYDDPIIGDISKDEFYLSYYGISELESPTQRSNTIRVVSMVIAILLICLGLGLRYLASRKA